MSSTTTLKAVLIGEDKSMGKTFDSVGRKASSAGKKSDGFGKSLLKYAGAVGIATSGVALVSSAFSSLTGFLGDSVTEGREAVKVGKTTVAIIKSTGGAAKVSAGQVAELSESLSEKAGVDDEVIQSGANLLLTFKNVRNEVGAGANVFDRATAAAVDLSAAGFGDINGASKMLGKALNDPLKGLTALGRAGVTFTAQQKKQIKTLVESGNVLGAQKVILAEVESQVGGVAAASADMGDKAKVAWANFKEDAGAKLLPVLDRLGAWFLNTGLPAVRKFGTWLTTNLWPALKEAWRTILPGLNQALDILSGGVGDGQVSWKKLGDVLTKSVIPFLGQLFRVYLPMVATQIRTIIEVVKVVWGVFTTWRNIMATVWGAIISGVTGMMRIWATMLRALSHVPGFGWAKTAADKMDVAAGKAAAIGRNISNIPNSKTVTVTVRTAGGRIRLPDGSTYNAGQRAGGGPTLSGRTYLVGENGPELWSESRGGHITPARQTAQMLRGSGGSGGSSSGGGYTGPEVVNVVVDGKVIAQALLRQKRLTGPLGLG